MYQVGSITAWYMKTRDLRRLYGNDLFKPRQFIDIGKSRAKPTVMALGFFDGLHHGHRKVIETALQKAKEKKVQLCSHEFFSTSENRYFQWEKTSVLFNASI